MKVGKDGHRAVIELGCGKSLPMLVGVQEWLRTPSYS